MKRKLNGTLLNPILVVFKKYILEVFTGSEMCDSVRGSPVTESHVCQGAFEVGKTHSNEHNLLQCYGLQ